MLEDDVRWVGEYAPFMRTTSDVLGSRIVHYVLASDVAPGNLAELSATLSETVHRMHGVRWICAKHCTMMESHHRNCK